jgi:protein-S-isoprenylcysteine O-methyltransferase Ste14
MTARHPSQSLGKGPLLGAILVVYWAAGAAGVLWVEWSTAYRWLWWAFFTAGAVMVLMGLMLYVESLRRVIPAMREGRLCRQGPYAMCRHPIYLAWGLLIGPGVLLLAGSWLGAFGPLLLHWPVRRLAMAEEVPLRTEFGEEYAAYRQKTPLLPGLPSDTKGRGGA